MTHEKEQVDTPLPSLAIEVFCAYASADEKWCRQLDTHLSVLKQQGFISLWHEQQILPGANRAEALNSHLETASIILLLISPDFLSSDYCYSTYMKRALERHQANEARVIPLVVRPCDWHHLPIGQLLALPTGAKPISTWRPIDTGWAQVAAGLRRVIEALPLLSASTPRTILPAIWNIPYPRNAFFLGRDELLSRLHEQLQTGQAMALSQSPQAISGLGGIGKTQIAIEYAYRYHQEYETVLWAQAENLETLNTSYSVIATLLQLPEREAKEQEVVIEALKNWLQRHHKWLLIFDNADDLSLVPSFLPPVLGGHLLLTTRAQAMGRLAQRLEVEALSVEQGALFVLRRAGFLAPDALFEHASINERKSAIQITQDLDGLPLALDQVGAYLEETGTNLNEYKQIYQQHRLQLLNMRGGIISDHPEPITTTWSLSFEQVRQRSLAATDLLQLCAFLAPDTISEEIITQRTINLGPHLSPIVTDPFLFSQAVEILRAYSLVKRDPKTRTLSIHRLVQVIIKYNMDEGTRADWTERTIQMIHAALPPVAHTSWTAWEQVLPHIQACVEYARQPRFYSYEAAELFQQAACYLMTRVRLDEAQPLLEQAYEIRSQLQGSEHLETIDVLSLLANTCLRQDNYERAESLYLQTLHIGQQTLGPKHSLVAQSLNGLANVYRWQNKYEQALALHQHALHILEQTVGFEHVEVAHSLCNVADLCWVLSQYEQVESLYLRALSIWEQQPNLESIDVTRALNGLGSFYRKKGQYEEADQFYQRAQHILQQILGFDHESVAHSLSARATIYYEQGRYKEAEPLYLQALHIRQQALGPEHSLLGHHLNGLATVYCILGQYEKAEELCLQALHIWEQALGFEHPDVAHALIGLGDIYYARGQYEQSESVYRRGLSICEQRTQDPWIAWPLNGLARIYQALGSYQQAEALCLRALHIREQILGPAHPDTAYSIHGLASLYHEQIQYEQAEALYWRALTIRQEYLGEQHPETAEILHDLARLCEQQKSPEKALEFYQRAFRIRYQILGDKHSKTISTRILYVSLLQKMGRDAEAKEIEGND